ncbi:hypothetical protein FJQ87_04130 [Shewanella sp. SNU WT4]|uniref:hypothetical protein n=1 Tax=Shewanella sp. SNU WT4 TaxID=2590015 RepID=UPI001128EE4D|nr:hypothetical protein [Shewanella sp. SNU WT4]QDF65971.1 hypothetical protein FJQ87_04130 [Shewanella sp. SNU WT4]
MSKLFKLRNWVTIEEAAQYLSEKINEVITVTDLYRLAYEGHLQLSVYLVNRAFALKGTLGELFCYEAYLTQQAFEVHDSTVFSIDGVWDLTMQGSEAVEIKNKFLMGDSALKVTTRSKNGVLLHQDGVTCQLYKFYDSTFDNLDLEDKARAIANDPTMTWKHLPSIVIPRIRFDEFGIKYVPCDQLSDVDCMLIVRRRELESLIELLEVTQQDDKPISTNEKNSLLVLIAALCNEANVDWNQRGISTSLTVMTDHIGASLTDDTIRKILKQIPSAIESRSK